MARPDATSRATPIASSGNGPVRYSDPRFLEHLAGAIAWAGDKNGR